MGLAVTKQEAFWEACGYGRISEVQMMLETNKDIDVNWKSYTHNCCPIHVASQGKREIVEMLLQQNCDVNVRDDRDNLAIHHAAMKGHADILQLLLDAGSEIDAQDKNGWTSLINAAYWCQPEACRVLVTNQCNVHLKNKDERNALHEACRSQSDDEEGLAQIVQLLVERGCDLNSKSSDVGEADFTPLMFCGYHGHAKVAKILIDADCDINAQGSNGWSALHWAADRGHIDTVHVLLNGGINATLPARRGEVALERAADNMVREAIADAMNLNGSEYKIALETRGSNGKKLYIPSPTQAQCAEVTCSPITSAYLAQSPALTALQQQMSVLSTQSRTKKHRRTQRHIHTRIFQPPAPPKEHNDNNSPPVVGMMDCEFDFMDDDDDEEEDTNQPSAATNHTTNSVENSTPQDNKMENSTINDSQNLVNGNNGTLDKEREFGHIVDSASTSQVIDNNTEALTSQA